MLEEVRLIASKYRDRADPSKIVCRSVWRKGMEVAPDLQVTLSSVDDIAVTNGIEETIVAGGAKPPGGTGRRQDNGRA